MTSKIPSIAPDDGRSRIVERPDGFWWQQVEGGREHGPFATLMEAMLDLQAVDDEGPSEDPEDVREAERQLGVPELVDPETGQLADDEHTRTEEH